MLPWLANAGRQPCHVTCASRWGGCGIGQTGRAAACARIAWASIAAQLLLAAAPPTTAHPPALPRPCCRSAGGRRPANSAPAPGKARSGARRPPREEQAGSDESGTVLVADLRSAFASAFEAAPASPPPVKQASRGGSAPGAGARRPKGSVAAAAAAPAAARAPAPPPAPAPRKRRGPFANLMQDLEHAQLEGDVEPSPRSSSSSGQAAGAGSSSDGSTSAAPPATTGAPAASPARSDAEPSARPAGDGTAQAAAAAGGGARLGVGGGKRYAPVLKGDLELPGGPQWQGAWAACILIAAPPQLWQVSCQPARGRRPSRLAG
jgi:hypothetical protein